MDDATFHERFNQAVGSSPLCVGLDVVFDSAFPKGVGVISSVRFVKDIIDATADYTSAYKLNLAFWMDGYTIERLQELAQYVRTKYPDKLMIADVKLADVEHTSQMYAKAWLDYMNFDAVTLSPWGGPVSLMPFFDRGENGKGSFVWVYGPEGSDWLHSFNVLDGDGRPASLSRVLMLSIKDWDAQKSAGFVISGDAVEQLRLARFYYPEAPILIPGVGAQGANLQAVCRACPDRKLINISRGILEPYVENNYLDMVRLRAEQYQQAIAQGGRLSGYD